MFRSLIACVSLAAFAAAACLADTPSAPPVISTPIPTAPQVDARAYILVDYRTDKVLAAKDPETRLEPASLTKLMTAYIVFQQLAVGKTQARRAGECQRACLALRRVAHLHRIGQARIGPGPDSRDDRSVG